MHAHRVEGENEVGRVLIFDGVGDSYGMPSKVMMDTQVRGGNVLDEFDWISLGGMDWVCIGLFMGWAVIVGFLGQVSTRKTQKGIHSKGR